MKSFIDRLQFVRFAFLHMRSPRAIRKWQERRLLRLVKHAYSNVPLWRELFAKHGVEPSALLSLEDIRKLPIISKEIFFGRTAEEYIDNSRAPETGWSVTSGTSGKPFRFLKSHHAESALYTDHSYLRFLWWRGEYFKKFSSINIARIKVRAPGSAHRLIVRVSEFLQNPHETLSRIRTFQPEIISSYPSILFDMAKILEEDPLLPRPAPRFACLFGEMLTPLIRARIEKVLGCEVYDRYGLEEIGVIGLECSEHDGYHLNSESVVVEILDKENAPVKSGESGRIIATDLFNYNMPFIRYETGDQGYGTNEPCGCGLRLPRIWITGRYSSYLTFTSRKIHHLEFDGALDGFMDEVFQYQIAKTSDARLVARVIPGPAYSSETSRKIRENLQDLAGMHVAVDVETVKEIPLSPRGKSRIIADESKKTLV